MTVRILLSAFACKPNSGSETGVGWRWALEMARDHEVVVITDESRRPDIEAELAKNPIANPRFVYYRPRLLARLPLNSRTAQFLYAIWQFGVVWLARRLHREQPFDLVHHLTYGVFRHPSFLGFVGPPFVFGPVGGGEKAPWALTHSMPRGEKLREYVRHAINVIARFDPFLWLALSRTSLILTKTPETTQAIPAPFRGKCVTQLEIGINAAVPAARTAEARDGESFRILYAGRLLGLKGIHLGLRAVAKAAAGGRRVEFVIVGSGPMHDHLQALTRMLGIEALVRWIGHIPQPELFALYASADCLLFPSLHDSSGNVVLEAMSFGLPVVCLDLGGPAVIVDDSCAMVVSTAGRDEEQTVAGICAALCSLMESPELARRLSQGAIQRSASMTWSKQVEKTMGIIGASITPAEAAC